MAFTAEKFDTEAGQSDCRNPCIVNIKSIRHGLPYSIKQPILFE